MANATDTVSADVLTGVLTWCLATVLLPGCCTAAHHGTSTHIFGLFAA